jgi:hypothetical protein
LYRYLLINGDFLPFDGQTETITKQWNKVFFCRFKAKEEKKSSQAR